MGLTKKKKKKKIVNLIRKILKSQTILQTIDMVNGY